MERLGVNGYKEVKAHPWLKDFRWDLLNEKKLKAPYLPNVYYNNSIQPKDDNFDARNINEQWKDDEEALKQNTLLLEDKTVQEYFAGYYFDRDGTPAMKHH